MWRVGELARETALTVRTLHHYDEIGLLSPSRRSDSGYRLYSGADVGRLQQIRSLRMMGFALNDIRLLLEGSTFSPLQVIELHLARLKGQIAAQQTLLERLENLAARLAVGEPEAGDVVRAIEVMSMTEQVNKYYTPEQLEQLKQRREIVGDERISQVESEWPRLIEEMRSEQQRGTDPASPKVQELARRWQGLVEEFTGGDPAIAASLNRMYEGELEVRRQTGVDPELMGYVRKAMEAVESR